MSSEYREKSSEPSSLPQVSLGSGYLFAHRYRIVRRIGAGGMGAVYECTQLETGRRRALKVLLPHLLSSDAHRARFRREAHLPARVDSDFIVDVMDAGVDDVTGFPYLVMELLHGEDLGRRLQRVGPLSPRDTVTYLHQVAIAVDRCHQASIVHRDLKPANLFVVERQDGMKHVKVLDFGIAKILEHDTTEGSHQLGTPAYMAPEQVDRTLPISSATDIYALGMVAYSLLVGVSYWHEEARDRGPYAVAALVRSGLPEPASVRAARQGISLSPEFDPWFDKATARESRRRFVRATDAVGALAMALGVQTPRRLPQAKRAAAVPTTPPDNSIATVGSMMSSEQGGSRSSWGLRSGALLALILLATVGIEVARRRALPDPAADPGQPPAAAEPALRSESGAVSEPGLEPVSSADRFTQGGAALASHHPTAEAGAAPASSGLIRAEAAPAHRPPGPSRAAPPVSFRPSSGKFRSIAPPDASPASPSTHATVDPLERWGDCPHPGRDGVCR